MGIIGTPVIDKARGVLYVVSLTRVRADAPGLGARYTQRLHELDIASGADLPESPVTIKADGFNAMMQNQRPALMLANGMVYVGYASHCDKEPYHGYLMAYDAWISGYSHSGNYPRRHTLHLSNCYLYRRLLWLRGSRQSS